MKALTLLLAISLFFTSNALADVLQADTSQSTAALNSQDRDIGSVSVPGSASNNGSGGFTVTASGEDIWGTADEFHYVYVSLDGDMEMIARVTGIDFTDGWAKAGLMVRATLDANSPNFMAFFTPAHYSGIQFRASAGGGTSWTGGPSVPFPYWLKLTRTGNIFTGYFSADGNNWTVIGSTSLSLPSTVYVGLAVTSHHDGTLCTASFDNVTQSSTGTGGGGGGTTGVPTAPAGLTVTGVSSNSIALQWTDTSSNESAFRVQRSTDGSTFSVRVTLNQNTTSFTDFGVSPSTHYWYRVDATNNAGSSPPSNVADATTTSGGPPPYEPPRDQDIGDVGAAGRENSNQDFVSMSGSGEDIYGTADAFNFFHWPATGDFEMVVTTDYLANTSPWAKAGIMARETLNANARNFFVFHTPSSDTGVQWRSQVGGNTSYTPGGSGVVVGYGQQLKLVRIGNTFSGYRSPDGQNWTLIASTTMPLASTLRVGLAVTSHNRGVLADASFYDVEGPKGPGGSGGGGTFTPYPPTDLKAAVISPNSIALTWTDRAFDETAYSVARSQDGVNFNVIAMLGSNSTSYTDTGLTPSTHYWYAVTANNGAGSSPPATTDATTTGSAWHDQDIGNVSAAGNSSGSGSTLTVGGSGSDIWGNADEFHYTYQSGTNDAQIVARVTGMMNTSPWAKAGVMIRASVAPGAQHVVLVLTPGNGLAFQWRSTTDGPSSYIDAGAASAPVWVKLVKSGNTFTGYRSADGVNWIQVGSVNIAMPGATFLVGLAVTSDNDGTVCLANFDNVTITGAGSSGGGTNGVPAAPSGLTATGNVPVSGAWDVKLAWSDNSTNETAFVVQRSTNGTTFTQIAVVPSPQASYTDSGTAPDTHYWYRVAATNNVGLSPWSNVAEITSPSSGTIFPPPWQNRDIGTSGGSGRISNDVFTIIGQGADIYGTSDQFNFEFMSVSGDQTIIAAIDRIAPYNTTYIDGWARIGLMIRETLDVNAKNAMVFLSTANGNGFTWRDATGGNTQYVGPGKRYTPAFLRLTRSGNTFSAYVGPDGHSWDLIGSATISMVNSVYIGLAVTSHSAVQTQAQLSQVTVTAGSGGGSGGGGGSGSTLPAPWHSQDIGPVGIGGSASVSQGTFTLKGSGADIWGTTDAFQYVYQTISGNGELVARLNALQNTEPWAKAGLMFRESLNYNAANAFVMATPEHGTGLQWRAATAGGSSYVPGPFFSAPVWLKLKRQGDVITASSSLDGANWTLVGSQSVPIIEPMLMGLAVTSHNDVALNTSTFDNVMWTPTP